MTKTYFIYHHLVALKSHYLKSIINIDKYLNFPSTLNKFIFQLKYLAQYHSIFVKYLIYNEYKDDYIKNFSHQTD